MRENGFRTGSLNHGSHYEKVVERHCYDSVSAAAGLQSDCPLQSPRKTHRYQPSLLNINPMTSCFQEESVKITHQLMSGVLSSSSDGLRVMCVPLGGFALSSAGSPLQTLRPPAVPLVVPDVLEVVLAVQLLPDLRRGGGDLGPFPSTDSLLAGQRRTLQSFQIDPLTFHLMKNISDCNHDKDSTSDLMGGEQGPPTRSCSSSDVGGGSPDRRRSSSDNPRCVFSLARQLSALESRQPGSPLVDIKPIEFWAMGPRKEVVQPLRKPLPPPGDYFRKLEPRLYSADSGGEERDALTDEEMSRRYQLGMLHFSAQYDLVNAQLGVRVIEARDLPPPAAGDAARHDLARSNPYVKMSLLPDHKNSRQTGVKRKTQNPVFEEHFTFQLPFLEAQRRTLLLSVVDFDKFSHHCVVGKVVLPLSEVDLVKGGHWWKALNPSSQVSGLDLRGDLGFSAPGPAHGGADENEVELGELLLSLNYLPSAGRLNVDVIRAKQLLQTDMCQGSGSGTSYLLHARGQTPPTSSNPGVGHLPPPPSDQGPTPPTSSNPEVRHLPPPPTPRSDTSHLLQPRDPFVKVQLVSGLKLVKTKKTSCMRATIDPFYNESFSFRVAHEELSEVSLVFTVYGHNMKSSNDFVGRVVIGQFSTGPAETTHWRRLLRSQRTPVEQWHSLRSRAECDRVSPASLEVT
ncbi:hypothetical protein P4O66_007815 [Electrophorus voltai]|uniref:Synaptotagmin-17 n=1 Tax=Electrophorus voltai TaxID=2609070 RepID=A0AAD8ZFZ3_9TELE|nr:hypothetical protein P4O66_007815 [Electrophorus voltai]